MIDLKKENNEVYYSTDDLPKLTKIDIKFLLKEARKNPSNKCRFCMHKNVNDQSHEMFIVHLKNCYVRPHKHLSKVESMSVIEGEADAFFFDDQGRIINKIELGSYSSGKNFYYRIDKNSYHMLVIKSEFFIFYESTLGPFNRKDTIFPNWAPPENNDDFLNQLNNFKLL